MTEEDVRRIVREEIAKHDAEVARVLASRPSHPDRIAQSVDLRDLYGDPS